MLIPPDRLTPEEIELLAIIGGNQTEIVQQPVEIYQLFIDPIDKFIMAYVFELGMRQEDAADALNMSRLTVVGRIKKIRETVRKYATNKHLL